MAGVNWNSVKTEYITNPATSYRKLADKYKVNYTEIARRSKREGWRALREQNSDKTVTESVEVARESEVEAFAQLQRTAVYLIQRLDRNAQNKSDEELDSFFRDYTLSLKALRDVLQTPMDNRKKLAEIEAIRKNIDDSEPEAIDIHMDESVKEYMV